MSFAFALRGFSLLSEVFGLILHRRPVDSTSLGQFGEDGTGIFLVAFFILGCSCHPTRNTMVSRNASDWCGNPGYIRFRWMNALWNSVRIPSYPRSGMICAVILTIGIPFDPVENELERICAGGFNNLL